jgi:hypothetical protein
MNQIFEYARVSTAAAEQEQQLESLITEILTRKKAEQDTQYWKTKWMRG